jgi:hypothetical protein
MAFTRRYGFTYQRILNLARQRHPRLGQLLLDDAAVVDDLNLLLLEVIDRVVKDDHSTFQRNITFNTDILPHLDLPEGWALPVVTTGGFYVLDPTATTGATFVGTGSGYAVIDPAVQTSPSLADYDVIQLPDWVLAIHAAQVVYSGTDNYGDPLTRRLWLRRKEEQIRELPDERDVLAYDIVEKLPQAWLEHEDGVWQIRKWKQTTQSWTSAIDINFTVIGTQLSVGNAALTDPVPLPMALLRPLAERYAVLLGQRADLPQPWLVRQGEIAEGAMEQASQFIGDYEIADDPAFDPDIQ